MTNKETELDKQDQAEIKNYTRTPNMLIFGYHDTISPQEKWLYVCLKHMCGKRGTRHLSLRYISENTGISVGALSKSKDKKGNINEGMIMHLHAAGLIHAEIKKHGGKGNPVYHITITDVWGLNQAFFTRSEFGQDEYEENEPVRNSDVLVQNSDKLARNSDKPVQNSDEPVRKPLQYQDYIQDYKQDDNKTREQEESITDETATSTIVPIGTARTDLHSPDYYRFLPIPVTFNEAVEYLAPHGGVPEGCYDAVEIMQLARKLWIEAQEPHRVEQEIDDDPDKTLERMPAIPKGQRDDTGDTPASNNSRRSNSNPGLSIGRASRQMDNQTVLPTQTYAPSQAVREEAPSQPIEPDREVIAELYTRLGNKRPAPKNHSARPSPGAVVTPDASPQVSGVPAQQTLMAAPEKQSRAKKKPETPKGPPMQPQEDMAWGTRKCLAWFDFWRGAYLIGTYKNSQASTCAKGLAEQYTEEQVIWARTDMEADPYYISRGGCDVCDVAANIHKYLKRRNQPKGAPGQIRRFSSYDDPNYSSAGEFYPTEAERARQYAASI